jgi:hypothetical protein
MPLRYAALPTALLLAACGASTPANTANPADTANAAAPANAAQPQQLAGARRVRIGIDGEHGLEACHTNGRISGQDTVGVVGAPEAGAARVDGVEPRQAVDICERLPGWYGVVYRKGSDTASCGTGESLPGPRDYAGPCRSGWVPENDVEVTAG